MVLETPTIQGFVNWLHSLSRHSCHRVSQFIAKDVRYRSPAAETQGSAGIAKIFEELFDDAKSVTIRVNNSAPGQDGFTAFLRWDRKITLNAGHSQTLSGVTEVTLGTDGKIMSVIEYWDSVPDTLQKRGYIARLFSRR